MIPEGSSEERVAPRIKVLMYHKITAEEKTRKTHWTYVSKAQLKKHLVLLDRWGFTPITFRDFLLYKKGRLNLPKKSVIITFDDGYENVYKIAFPLLKEFGWNAVVFVLGSRQIGTDVWDEENGLPSSKLLSKEQIIEMHEAGFEIGSHSMNHLNLVSVPSDVAWNEINHSKELIQAAIKSNVRSFCYPYGLANKQLKNMVRESGYTLACGVYSGPPKFWADKYDIRRITISNSTNSLSFALKMLTPFEYFEWAGSKALNKVTDPSRKYSGLRKPVAVVKDKDYIKV